MQGLILFPPSPKNRRKRFELAREAYELVRRELPNALIVTGGSIHADTMPLYYIQKGDSGLQKGAEYIGSRKLSILKKRK